MKHRLLKLVFFTMLFSRFMWAESQISEGGLPFRTGEAMPELVPHQVCIDFDVAQLLREDALSADPPRCGIIVPALFSLADDGEIALLENGSRILRLKIEAKDALAIMLFYDQFVIPEGGKLFICNEDRSHVLGAYTSKTNPKKRAFATEFVRGDRVILEYLIPESGALPEIKISGISYGYNHFRNQQTSRDRWISGPCEVNINCPEGDSWQDQKRGVARIVMPVNGGTSLCSGTMIHNTAQDFEPLFLSAHHCFKEMTPQEMDQMVFYFNYELPGCENDLTIDPEAPTLVGAEYLVDIGIEGGSDGALLRLHEYVPEDYNVFFNGWDRRNLPATSGVGIHHPYGDVKKISTFTASPVSSTWNGGGATGAPDGHWAVKFVQTANGWGVTEGGSSGSPLFNRNGHVVGSLTGSNFASCENVTGTGFYGKLYSHWDQASKKMSTYLDPLNTELETLDGAYVDYRTVYADFKLPADDVYLSQKIKITNLSKGAGSYAWSFPGASIETSDSEQPPVIEYSTPGTYTVSLTVNRGTNDEHTKSITFPVYLKENLCPKEVTVGEGTAKSEYPLGGRQRQTMSVALYTAEETGFTGGAVISQLAWYSGYEGPERSVYIYLKETGATECSSTLWSSEIDGATLVYKSGAHWKSSTGWSTIQLDRPFRYSGEKNLQVMVRTVTAGTGNYINSNCSYTEANNMHQSWSSTEPSIINTAGTVNSNRPNIRIGAGLLCGVEDPDVELFINGSSNSEVSVYTMQEIRFSTQTAGPVVNWEWTMEGAEPAESLSESPVVMYANKGEYTVTLTVSNTKGTKTVTKRIAVAVEPPVPAFESVSTGHSTRPDYGQLLPYQGGQVTFTDYSTNTPTAWMWELSGASPASASTNKADVFYEAQTEAQHNTVKLTASNDGGSTTLVKEGYVKIGGAATIWNLPAGDMGNSCYEAPEGNYLTGTNSDYSSIAEKFTVRYPGTIDTVSVMIQVMKGDVASRSYMVAIYSAKDGLPHTSLKSRSIAGSTISREGYTTVVFNPPVEVEGDFFAVISGLSENENKVAVASSVKSNETVYIRHSNTWKRLSDLHGSEWSLSLNIAPHFTFARPSGGIPFNLTALHDAESRKVLLAWNSNIWENDPLLHSNLYRNGELIATGLSATSYEDANCPEGETVCYSVSAVYSGSTEWESEQSLEACLFIESSGASAASASQGGITLFPNPVTDRLNIQSATEVIEHITLKTIQGKTVFTEAVHNTGSSPSLASLASGIYIIHIKTTGAVYSFKIIKH